MPNKIQKFSPKVKQTIKQTGYLNVWEGSVRSGKTVASLWAWIYYISKSPENIFLMSGKTQATVYKNCVSGDFGMLALMGGRAKVKTHESGVKCITFKDKLIFFVGANDKSSYEKIRGMTIGGWYADEVNLYPKNFIEEAFRRSIVSTDRKNFWTLNPDTPTAWIYTEYIDRYEKEGLKGYYWNHFTLNDNPAITKEREEELKQQYVGVFYDRYILGLRVRAEGLVFGAFDPDKNTCEPFNISTLEDFYISCDYGTVNPMAWGLWGRDPKTDIWYKINEYYYNSKKKGKQKTDAEYCEDMAKFADEFKSQYVKDLKDRETSTRVTSENIKAPPIIIDPSAASFKVELKNKGFRVMDASNDVMDGIRTMNTLLYLGRVKYFIGRCPNTMLELRSYSWDMESLKEQVIKENDHAMDSDRYLCYTVIEQGKRWGRGVSFLH